MHFQIQSFLRAAIVRRPPAVRIGPFLVSFDDHDDSPFRNYAVPDDGASPLMPTSPRSSARSRHGAACRGLSTCRTSPLLSSSGFASTGSPKRVASR